MPGIPSKDASFVRETPRNYALTFKVTLLYVEVILSQSMSYNPVNDFHYKKGLCIST